MIRGARLNSIPPQQDIHISSGGVVYSYHEQWQPLVLLLYRFEGSSWQLPKGTPEPGESLVETALREIEEETGAIVRIQCYLGFEFSKFLRENTVIQKQTHYYLMHYLSGRLQCLDGEHDEVTWQSISYAFELLNQARSQSEARIVAKAQKVLHCLSAWPRNSEVVTKRHIQAGNQCLPGQKT
jgi:8-oxo-dGTP pyrophosphatase MutT (NUDIX family)